MIIYQNYNNKNSLNEEKTCKALLLLFSYFTNLFGLLKILFLNI